MPLTKITQNMIYGGTVSVLDFGAYRDGTHATETTAAINATIAYAKSQTNVHCIEFPTGNYAVNGTINVKGNFNRGIVLNGNKSLITSSHNGIVFDCSGGYPDPPPALRLNMRLRDFAIVGPGKANTSSIGVNLYAANHYLENVGIYNFYAALKGHGCLISEFQSCSFEDSYYGIWFDAAGDFSPNDNHFIKCNSINNIVAVKYNSFDYGAVNFIGCELEGNNLAGNSTDGVKVIEFSSAGEVNFIGTHFEMNLGSYNVYFDSPGGRHLNFVGCKVIPGDSVGSCVYVDHGELFMAGTMCLQNVGGNIVLTANTGSAMVVGDTGGLITGTLTKLVRIRQGQINAGAANPGSTAAGIQTKGYLGVGAAIEGSQWFVDSSGNRLGYATATGASLDAAAQYIISSGNGQLLFFRTGKVVEPASDNQYNLGSASLRWATVYAGTGTINTSDERAKQQIGAIPQEWLAAWGDVEYMRFKFNDAVQEKGDGARWHIGLVAQRVKEAFEKRGIDPFAIGLLCFDQWADVVIEEFAEDSNGLPVLDENGEPTKRSRIVKVAGDQYGIRYEEALALECAYLRSKLK